MDRNKTQFQVILYSCFPKRLLQTGFTFIELLVVMAIIATLLSIAAPRYFNSIDKANEAVLKARSWYFT